MYEMGFRRVQGRPSPWGQALKSVWASRNTESSHGLFTSYSRESRTAGCVPRRPASSRPSLKSAPSSLRWVTHSHGCVDMYHTDSCGLWVCVLGWIQVHINVNQMGQNVERRGSAPFLTNRKWQCDDRWAGKCACALLALINVSH